MNDTQKISLDKNKISNRQVATGPCHRFAEPPAYVAYVAYRDSALAAAITYRILVGHACSRPRYGLHIDLLIGYWLDLIGGLVCWKWGLPTSVYRSPKIEGLAQAYIGGNQASTSLSLVRLQYKNCCNHITAYEFSMSR